MRRSLHWIVTRIIGPYSLAVAVAVAVHTDQRPKNEQTRGSVEHGNAPLRRLPNIGNAKTRSRRDAAARSGNENTRCYVRQIHTNAHALEKRVDALVIVYAGKGERSLELAKGGPSLAVPRHGAAKHTDRLVHERLRLGQQPRRTTALTGGLPTARNRGPRIIADSRALTASSAF